MGGTRQTWYHASAPVPVPMSHRPPASVVSSLAASLCLLALGAQAAPDRPEWRKLELNREFLAEGGAFGDLNRDGAIDVVAGPYWYEGPDFARRHEFYPAKPFDPLQYSKNFVVQVDDCNSDGWPDILVVGFPGEDTSWFENPGSKAGAWTKHLAFEPTDNESPGFGDLLGNGERVLVCMSGGRLGFARRNPQDPRAVWTFHAVAAARKSWGRYTHGLGYGDVNGDGRTDLLAAEGWWEQPTSLAGDPEWQHHPADFGHGAQILVTDVNGDGRVDVISSVQAHGYGLAWFEQLAAPNSDGSTFRRHEILRADGPEKTNGVQFSQLHALALADMDGDKLPDIVTAKRWWAHGPGGDPEPNAAAVVYAFLLRRGADGSARFEPCLIDDASGAGTQIAVADANRDGRNDVLTVNKRGTFLFLSLPLP
jgi:hypothetical protein